MISKFKLIWALGLKNVFAVVKHRTALKFGLHPVQHLENHTNSGDFFATRYTDNRDEIKYDDDIILRLFGHKNIMASAYNIDWHINYFTGFRHTQRSSNWWEISDFSETDIKCIWELSRFNWLSRLAFEHTQSCNNTLPITNALLRSWLEDNPPFKGPNWKCGQEASIRVLNILSLFYFWTEC